MTASFKITKTIINCPSFFSFLLIDLHATVNFNSLFFLVYKCRSKSCHVFHFYITKIAVSRLIFFLFNIYEIEKIFQKNVSFDIWKCTHASQYDLPVCIMNFTYFSLFLGIQLLKPLMTSKQNYMYMYLLNSNKKNHAVSWTVMTKIFYENSVQFEEELEKEHKCWLRSVVRTNTCSCALSLDNLNFHMLDFNSY